MEFFLQRNHDAIIIGHIQRSTAKSHGRTKRTALIRKGTGIDVEEFNDRRDGGFIINVMLVKRRVKSLGILITRKWYERKRDRRPN